MKSVSEVSRETGVSKRTLQFYDDEGLVIVKRSKYNHRLYDDEAMSQMWKILLYRELNLSLKEIKELLNFTEKERNQYLDNMRKNLRVRIDFLDYIQNEGLAIVIPQNEGDSRSYLEIIEEIKRSLEVGE